MYAPIVSRQTLKNRIVRSATYDSLSQRQVTEDLINLYEKLAKGGTGLIITGAALAIVWRRKTTPSSVARRLQPGPNGLAVRF